ncbi:MAG: 50S ribosomal protein L30 [Alphaproteobacteria bacterium]|nr:50S ribosomal protein L30 [Alphaproteobacteria bacterium]
MSKIVVKQVKSLIGRPESQRKIIAALGLGRIGKTKELENSQVVRGMIAKVSHLIEVVEQ